ncbi:MAG TPA: aminotransferase class IV [Candidatus Latescibacteria bacterium]|jgi:branched-subunit amino acid aminotransferase/4-amino-4-deoxychorismate lyase|nr:branched-chain amino acid aminotransferase [Gemmatimonadaceae bacterium]MDP6017891.1 aminotransferase class IV [Candidatus Latescibacterota bacterium]HJP30498.1 aminotransferase class IV [Candidatus Latescibacterota bacterium]
MTEPQVYIRGQTVPASQAHVAIFDAAVVLGATVTDLARTFAGEPFRLGDHVDRFYRSCRYARIEPPIDRDETEGVCRQLLAHNGALLEAGAEQAVVLFISPGELSVYAGSAGGSDMTPTFCIHTFPLPFHLWRHFFDEGAHVVTPSVRQVPAACVDPKIKCRSRMHWWLADGETHQVDPRAVSLCLDLQGNVTETAGSNFLIMRDGVIISPSPDQILRGISLLTVIELCDELGIGFEERNFQVYDVVNADEAYLATTPYCLAPVTKINGIDVGTGQPGPVFGRLMAGWSKRVGLDIVNQIRAD